MDQYGHERNYPPTTPPADRRLLVVLAFLAAYVVRRWIRSRQNRTTIMTTLPPVDAAGRTLVRIRTFDRDFEVLTGERYTRYLDMASPSLDAELAGILAERTALARQDEAMDRPRLEVRDATSGALLRQYRGGGL